MGCTQTICNTPACHVQRFGPVSIGWHLLANTTYTTGCSNWCWLSLAYLLLTLSFCFSLCPMSDTNTGRGTALQVPVQCLQQVVQASPQYLWCRHCQVWAIHCSADWCGMYTNQHLIRAAPCPSLSWDVCVYVFTFCKYLQELPKTSTEEGKHCEHSWRCWLITVMARQQWPPCSD